MGLQDLAIATARLQIQLVRCGNFDIMFDHLSRATVSSVHTTRAVGCALLGAHASWVLGC